MLNDIEEVKSATSRRLVDANGVNQYIKGDIPHKPFPCAEDAFNALIKYSWNGIAFIACYKDENEGEIIHLFRHNLAHDPVVGILPSEKKFPVQAELVLYHAN